MVYVWAASLVAVNTVWLVLTVLTLPGNWLMVVTTALVAWWQWDVGMFSPWTLVAIAALAAGAEVLEFVSSVAGTRKAGGTRWGAVGSLLGAVVGGLVGTALIPIPLIGSLVGVCGGACLGAWALEAAGGRSSRQAMKAGMGAGVGRFVATVLKLAVGVVIWLIVAVAAYWP